MSLYNADELEAPSWINQEFLEKVLTQYENNVDVEVVQFDLSPASMKGDHYASIMFRCKVQYRFDKNASVKHKSMIIKTLPMEEGFKREMLMESNLFETEIDMYAETLPKIEKILADCGEPTKLSAELIYYALEPHKVIIFEDLCESGYDTIRSRFLNEDEIKAVYQKLAKLHAVSYMLGHSEEHELVTKYQYGILSMDSPQLEQMMEDGLRNFIDMLSCHDEFDVYYQKVKAMKHLVNPNSKNLYKAYQQQQQSKGDIFVLNHGDFHMKNMMFRFNKSNQMEDCIMVDYQISCYAPSNIDLVYSQIMMLSSELRLKRHELMQYYFTEFIRILKKVNYQGDLPLYSDFQISGLKYRHFTIFLVSTFLPMVVGFIGKSAEDLKNVDIGKQFENPDMMSMVYRMPGFVEEVRKFMPILLKEGYLD
ncbi:uncharacterized protein LOC131802377 [Musca domestica]|uniref:Uncharacterized protein LOC131802376 n=1 Tax=Musca domestica TaxID=7370 RepID=A0ABM3UYE8_MUSDO|nr:uncharacterized protein LOC131802376 [Musca domestica]XP_058978548.1 uncharacterized protein LOC131802377 [Musca domestica]